VKYVIDRSTSMSDVSDDGGAPDQLHGMEVACGFDRSFYVREYTMKLLTRPVAVAVLILAIGCVHVPLRARQDFRRQQFFATHREVSPAVTEAVNTGHVIIGMDQEEVWVVVGDPIRKTIFRGGTVEVRFYPAVRFHQGPRTRGADLFRLVFVNGRLTVIEPM
jgi:hypothetical protein